VGKGLLRSALATLDWVLAAAVAVLLAAAVVEVDARLARGLGLRAAPEGAPSAATP